jgi:uncharacterized protein YndB with AHSA1/START domain
MPKTNLKAEPGMHSITLIRDFDAPRDQVFKAFIDPLLIPKWWGLRSTVTTVDKLEVKPGGIWRYVQRDPEGNEFAFHGFFHQIATAERLVFTFEFEGMPGHVLMETVEFEEHDGKTRVTDTSVFQSVEARDGMLQSGMEQGANESWDQLAELLQGK